MYSKLKTIIICIILPLLFGFLGSRLGDSSKIELLNKPFYAPPSFIFPIVWTILYILMGISSYIIYTSEHKDKKKALTIYFIQLILNSLWTFFFFELELLLFSFWWIKLIIFLVIIMIYYFYKINPTSAYLQIPYLIWLIFASILNFSIYLLN